MNNETEIRKISEEESEISVLKDDLRYIGQQYGVRHQIKRVQSEIFELNEAILNYENAKDSPYTQNFDQLRTHVIEEYADVFNMLTQILLLYNIDKKDLLLMMRAKADKQLNKMQRIEEIKRMINDL